MKWRDWIDLGSSDAIGQDELVNAASDAADMDGRRDDPAADDMEGLEVWEMMLRWY